MNYGIITRVLGNLLIFEAMALLPSLAIGLFLGESAAIAFVYTIVVLLVLGIPMTKLVHATKRIRIRDALVIVTLGWVSVSFFGALPFVFSGEIPALADAFFETVSGLTTTGATIVDHIEGLSKSILFWRSLTHWLGGMGILVLTLAILPAMGVGGFQIFKAESTGPISDKLVPKMKDTAKILYLVYTGVTLAQTLLLMLGGMSLFEALIHTFGTVGTGGFSTNSNSVGGYSSFIIYVISIFMIISGVNFGLYYDLYRGRWRNFLKNGEMRLYLLIITVSTVLITINLYGSFYSSIFETFKHALFQVSSIITTTGFATADFDQWPSFSKLILFFLMFVGGSAGSTAGSIKVVRILLLGKLVKRQIQKLIHPRAYIPVQLNGKMVSSDVLANVAGFFFLYMVLFVVGTLLISLEGISIVSAATSVAATLGNVGPGLEMVGPARNFSGFTDLSKYFFSLLMLFGRLELFTIFLFFFPSFWENN